MFEPAITHKVFAVYSMDFVNGLRKIYDGSLEIHDTECRRSIKARHQRFISLNAENTFGQIYNMRRYYASLWWMNFKPIELLDQQKVCYGVSSVLLSLLAIFFF